MPEPSGISDEQAETYKYEGTSTDRAIDTNLSNNNYNDDEHEDMESPDDNWNVDSANSIIGGSSVVSKIRSNAQLGPPDSSDDEQEMTLTSEDLKRNNLANQHKIFTFSLPFGGGGNPLLHLPSLKSLTQSFPLFGNSENIIEDNDFKVSLSKAEIGSKLRRQESISTLEEAFFFHGLKGQGSSRLKAVTNALTPNISIPSFNDDDKKKTSVWDTIKGDIVILGGYRGSVLRDTKTKRRVWIPIKAGFNMQKVDLLIGPTDEDEEQAQRDMYSDDILSHVGPIDICRKLISKLENGKTNVHSFGYDWRLSPDILSKKFYDYLKDLESKRLPENQTNGTLVIAHSMGGLIAHHVMQREPSLFRGLLYVGVPAECPNNLGPLRQGDKVLMSSKILTAEANFFMRSSFVFLPLDGRCFINRKTLENIRLDYFDVETWIEYNLSPPIAKERLLEEMRKGPDYDEQKYSTTFDEAKDYLERTLKRNKKFLLELEYDPTKEYPPLAMVYGNQVPTVRGVRVDSPDGIRRGEYDDFFYGPGDGVVNHKWLMPEKRGFPVNAKISSDKGHISLMCDFEAMEKALEALVYSS